MRPAVLTIGMTAAILLLAMLGGLASAQTITQGVPDATCPPTSSMGGRHTTNNYWEAQTFTALSNGRLTGAEVMINEPSAQDSSGDIVVKVARVDAEGRPTNDILASTVIPDAEVDSSFGMRVANFPLESSASVVAGKRYALIVHKSNATSFIWWQRDTEAPNCVGRAYYRNPETVLYHAWNTDHDYIYKTYVTAIPKNDYFASARVIKGRSVSVAGSTFGATRQSGEPDHYTSGTDAHFWIGNHTVWYRWTAPASGTTTIDTCEANIDSIFAVYTGDRLRDLKRVVDNNNGCESGWGSKVTFRARVDRTYRIVVGDAGGAVQNSFTLRLQR